MSCIALIDGYNFIFRAYYSHHSLTTSDNFPTGALYGFTSMILKFLSSRKFDYIAVVCDSAEKTFRHDLYADYKANRTAAPLDLLKQLPLIDEAITALSLPLIRCPGFEADDLIATLAKKSVAMGIEVEIVSSDKDLAQLVDDMVYIYNPHKEIEMHANEVFEKFGVYPDKLLDLLSLVGDVSDNIPGAYGIGIKTAVKLINEFGSLEKLIDNVNSIKAAKCKEKIINALDNIVLSRSLIVLHNDAPVGKTSIKDLKIGSADTNLINNFLAKYEFRALTNRFEKLFNVSLSRNENIAKSKRIDTITELSLVKEKLQKAYDAGIFAIEIFSFKGAVKGILLGFEEPDDYFFVPTFEPNNLSLDFNTELKAIPIRDLLDILSELLGSMDVIKIVFDAKSLLHICDHFNLLFVAYRDLSTMFYAIKSYTNDSSPSAIATILGKDKLLDYDNQWFNNGDIDSSFESLAKGFVSSIAVYNHLNKELWYKNVCYIYEMIDAPSIRVLTSMESLGVAIDRFYLKVLMTEFNNRSAVLENAIYQMAGIKFNINSPKQLNEVLFEHMGIEHKGRSKKANIYSTDSIVLESLEENGVEIAGKILGWRSMNKLVNTYLLPLLKNSEMDGRVRTNYLINGTVTGRLSSVGPNLQNIPIKDTEGRKIRRAFVAKKNSLLVSVDYSQIELRILAHYAEVTDLITAFRNDIDVHTATAAAVFNCKTTEVTDTERRKAKMINFGIVYGISAFGLSKRLGCSVQEANKYIDDYFNRYPGIKSYIDNIKNEAKKMGFVRTIYGRYCFVPSINSGNYALRSYAERMAINAPMQGSAADIMKLAMIKVFNLLNKYGLKSNIIMQIHDELVLECPIDELHTVKDILLESMMDRFSLSVPLVVDIKYGMNWLEMS
ncbi:DNA polymerase I [Candidatus Xenohaliotis californiensis]|uniref:DNA polymerase I n=1 Tax=Candidatus Xenohaliotis californiensis TaxID=84677 RepID=A0ABP0ERS0_9RICK|nr:DNA polymerase I [Candidatus Xenohaliotis californiensis]